MARRALGPASLAVVQAVEALPAEPWVVGCSGGADSLALTWAAQVVGARRGTAVRAVTVDHGLQEGSGDVAERVRGDLAGRGIEATVVRVALADGTPGGVESAARDARYDALASTRRPHERVLLGHTLDDQAETVLLGLARGAGLRAIAGMPPERGSYRRPLLALRRAVTRAACAEQGFQPWDDPHNEDPGFARVRVRLHALPALEEALGPGIAEALARTAALARRDANTLDALAHGDTPPHCGYLLGLDPALRSRRIRDWLVAAGARDLAASHLSAVDRLVTDWRGQVGVDVPGGRVVRIDGRLNWVSRSR